MEGTVSGNGIPAVTEPEEPVINEPEEPSTIKPDDSGNAQEAAAGAPIINSYTYEIDNDPVCSLLEQLVSGTEKQNMLLENILENLDVVKESLTAVPEETLSIDAITDESDDTENSQEAITEMVKCMEETLSSIKETGEGISETVSGNAFFLEDISGSVQTLTESYTEASEIQYYTYSYGLAFGAGILFVAACIAGLHIAKSVWEKMR